jgi:hypothetical protein
MCKARYGDLVSRTVRVLVEAEPFAGFRVVAEDPVGG